MKTNALLALALAASALMTCAQEPRVTHTQYHSGPMSLGLSATVDRFRHSNGPLWLGYAVQALPRTVGAGQRRLHQILSEMLIAGQQICRAQ